MRALVRIAAVDLGTNTTRLLVADVRDGRLEQVGRRSEVTRLGEGVDASGRLGEPAMERVFAVLEDYRRAMDELNAERTVAVATSAVRDSANGEEFRRMLHERFGLDVRIITGDEEARVTFKGATERRRTDGEPLLVLDIGGGSTEFVIGHAGRDPDFHVSTQAGSVRQTERHISTDPPERHELDALEVEVRGIVEKAVPAELRAGVGDGIAVAGTPTSLAAIEQRLETYDRSRVDGYRLELSSCERMLAMLAGMPESERREVPGLHPGRAPTIVAGAAILVQAMHAFGLESMEVSEHDILDGAALEAAR